jgi:hypothetical protein
MAIKWISTKEKTGRAGDVNLSQKVKKKIVILIEIFLPDESERKKKFNLFLCTTWHGPDCLFVQVKHKRRIFSG